MSDGGWVLHVAGPSWMCSVCGCAVPRTVPAVVRGPRSPQVERERGGIVDVCGAPPTVPTQKAQHGGALAWRALCPRCAEQPPWPGEVEIIAVARPQP